MLKNIRRIDLLEQRKLSFAVIMLYYRVKKERGQLDGITETIGILSLLSSESINAPVPEC